ncbi:MAG: 50S ribosomal protein L11 methyltransferase [Gammaproteobacteria bacterium]|nr:50S ribosomal protein L11 methyltransferase [Gammaproteobacteria bacterium]
MPWVQLKLHIASPLAEKLEAMLSELGAAAVTMTDAEDQPLFEPPVGTTPLWDNTIVTGLFPAETSAEFIISQLEPMLGDTPLPEWKAEILEDQDWTRTWMDSFKPMRFGKRLWICPSTYEPPAPDDINILLDPGLAFGTGTHPTTAMCLTWLDEHPPTDKTVIDYGCGSGILALAAAKLGARNIYAIDNDPQALIATRSNSEQNGLAGKIQTFLPDEFKPVQVDLLLANILAGPLHELVGHFARLLIPGGQLVLSGLLENQASDLISTYETSFDLVVYQQEEEWVCLHGRRRI